MIKIGSINEIPVHPIQNWDWRDKWLKESANPVGGVEERMCVFAFGEGVVMAMEICLNLE